MRSNDIVRRRAQTWIGRAIPALVVAAAAAAPAAAAAGAAATEERLETARIYWFDPVGPRVVTVRMAGGYCLGEEVPTLRALRVREGGRVEGGGKLRVVLTAILERGPATEGARIQSDGEDPEPIEACSGIERSIERRVHFRRPVSELAIFDGSRSPPARVPALNGNRKIARPRIVSGTERRRSERRARPDSSR